jgi:hypothetical protein
MITHLFDEYGPGPDPTPVWEVRVVHEDGRPRFILLRAATGPAARGLAVAAGVAPCTACRRLCFPSTAAPGQTRCGPCARDEARPGPPALRPAAPLQVTRVTRPLPRRRPAESRPARPPAPPDSFPVRRRGAWVPDHAVRRHICPDAAAEAAWTAFAARPRADAEIAQVVAAHLSLARRLAPAGWTAAAHDWDGPVVTYSDGVTGSTLSGQELLAAARRLFAIADRGIPPAIQPPAAAFVPAGPVPAAVRASDLQIALFG